MSIPNWGASDKRITERRPGTKASEALAGDPGIGAPLSHPSEASQAWGGAKVGAPVGHPPTAEPHAGGEPAPAADAPARENCESQTSGASQPSSAPARQTFGGGHSESDLSDLGERSGAGEEPDVSGLRESGVTHAAPIGLSNIGNTCFMNSGIQCFMSSWILQNLLMTAKVTQKGTGVVPALRRLLVAMAKQPAAPPKKSWWGLGGGHSPSDIKSACQRINPVFRGYGQQDSFELIQALIEGVIVETNAVTGKLPYKELNTGKLPLEKSYEVQRSYYLSRTSSPFSEALSGVYLNEFRCTKCRHVSYVFEFSQTLSLELNPHQNATTGSWEGSEVVSESAENRGGYADEKREDVVAGEESGWARDSAGASTTASAPHSSRIEAEAVGKASEASAYSRSSGSAADSSAASRGAFPVRGLPGGCPHYGGAYGADRYGQAGRRKPLTLSECITMAFSPHIIPEHKCDNCLSNAPVELRTSIFVPPKVLVIQLKRFSAGKGSWGGMSKDERSVDYAERIDLSPFLRAGAPSSPAAYLFSAASLHGGSLFGGHYTAVVTDHREYYYCNDSSVHTESRRLPSEAYVLVFEREDALQELMRGAARDGEGRVKA